jgi:hypothetical protein
VFGPGIRESNVRACSKVCVHVCERRLAEISLSLIFVALKLMAHSASVVI